MMKTSLPLCIAALALAALTACAPIAQVHEIRPVLAATPGKGDELVRAESAVATGRELEQRDPIAALGIYVNGVGDAFARLQQNPRDQAALRDYNFDLSRMLAVIDGRRINPWSHPLQLPAATGGCVLALRKDSRALPHPEDYELIPVDQLSVGGSAFGKRVKREGWAPRWSR